MQTHWNTQVKDYQGHIKWINKISKQLQSAFGSLIPKYLKYIVGLNIKLFGSTFNC